MVLIISNVDIWYFSYTSLYLLTLLNRTSNKLALQAVLKKWQSVDKVIGDIRLDVGKNDKNDIKTYRYWKMTSK